MFQNLVLELMDEENNVLRKNGERENIEIGSLEKTITNGNWGE